MQRETVDIFIAGAGPAGLIAAAALAAGGARVLVADPAPRPAAANGPSTARDLRSTAFLAPARTLFDRIGLWPALAPAALPLDGLRLVDLAGEPPAVRTARTFRAEGDGPLAWNLPNDAIRTAVLAHLDAQPNVELAFGTGFARATFREAEALVALTDGRQLSARLAVAADGRGSALRGAAGIGTRVTRYGQKALAFAVTHPEPHDGISTEFYLDGGAFTLVPIADHGGSPASAAVWMNPGRRTLELAALDDAAFGEAATRRCAGAFGPLTPVSRRDSWPVVTQLAERLTGCRLALIAEAAHVLPPIGAQGLNTSVADIAALARVALGAADPGAPAVLDAYARARGPDLRGRSAAIDLFNRVTRDPAAPLQALRRLGLVAAHDLPPLRRALMRAGRGPG